MNKLKAVIFIVSCVSIALLLPCCSNIPTAYPDNSELHEHWLFISAPGVDRPGIVGIMEIAVAPNKRVYGGADIKSPHLGGGWLRWKSKGRLSNDNSIELSVSEELLGDNITAHGDKVAPLGKLVATKRLEGKKLIWDGWLTIENKKQFTARHGEKYLRENKLYPVPDKLKVQFVRYPQNEMRALSDLGTEPGLILATWSVSKAAKARAWLSNRHYKVTNSEQGTEDGRRVYRIEVPAFNEDMIVWDMLSTGLFDEVTMEGIPLGPGDSYFVNIPFTRVFPNGLSARGAASESFNYMRMIKEKLSKNEAFSKAEIDVVPDGNHRFEVVFTGPSKAMSQGPTNSWDRYRLSFQFMRHLGQPQNELTIQAMVIDEGRAKKPLDGAAPPRERFSEPIHYDEGMRFLKTLGAAVAEAAGSTDHTLSSSNY